MKKLILVIIILLTLSACSPSEDSQYLQVGRDNLANYEYSLALQNFKLAIAEQPTNPEGYILAADLLIRKNQLDDALELLEMGDNNTKSSLIKVRIGQIHRIKLNYTQAEQYFREAISFNDENSSAAREGLLKILGVIEKNDDLISEAKQVPSDSDSELLLAKIYLLRDSEDVKPLLSRLSDKASGTIEEAYEIINEALSKDASQITLFDEVNMSFALMKAGWKEITLPTVSKAISENEYYETPYLYRGIILSQEKRLEEALSDFQKAITLNPDYLEAKINLLALYLEQEDTDSARVLISATDFQTKLSSDQLVFVMDLLTGNNDLESAEMLYIKANPESITDKLTILYTKVLAEKKDFETALKFLSDIDPSVLEEINNKVWYARLLYESGDIASAEKEINEIKSIDRANAELFLLEAQIKIDSGLYPDAKQLLERAIDVDFGSSVTIRANELLLTL